MLQSRKYNRYILLNSLGFALLLSSICLSETGLPDPEKPGPYPVGVTTMLFEDYSRIDEKTGRPRPLLTEIWYPATEDAKNLPKNRLTDFYLKGTKPGIFTLIKQATEVDLIQVDQSFKNISVRDARIEDGRFPLILFSHGNGGFRMQSAFWCEHMASHGYVVMSPDHTRNCSLTVVDGKVILYDKEGRERSAIDRPKDLSFLIDAMERMHHGADSRFLGKIDLDHIGVAGHSFGGYTAAKMADEDHRIDAIAPMAAVGHERTNFHCPAMILIATEDSTIKTEGNHRLRQYYEESLGPCYLVEFLNAGHYSFTEMFQFNPHFGDGVGTGKRITNGEDIIYMPVEEAFRLTNGYTAAFFGKYLKGMNEYDRYLDVNHLPKELIVKFNEFDLSHEE